MRERKERHTHGGGRAGEKESICICERKGINESGRLCCKKDTRRESMNKFYNRPV